MKNILVLTSGGLDSTYLVYDNLKKGNKVKAIYLEILNNDVKSNMEKKALNLQREYFENKFENYSFKTDSMKIEIEASDRNLKFDQIPLFLTVLLFNTKDIDEIQIGYVMNDDAVSFIEELKIVYQTYKPFVNEDKLPELTFPLVKLKKEEFINYLPKELIKTIVFCENPIYIEKEDKYLCCNSCPVCKRYLFNDLGKVLNSENLITLKDFVIVPLNEDDIHLEPAHTIF